MSLYDLFCLGSVCFGLTLINIFPIEMGLRVSLE
jgi:hypothetical protein